MKDDESNGYADYIGDGVFFLICLIVAIMVAYIMVPLLQPSAWWSL